MKDSAVTPGFFLLFVNSSISALPTITASAYSLIVFTCEGFDTPKPTPTGILVCFFTIFLHFHPPLPHKYISYHEKSVQFDRLVCKEQKGVTYSNLR